LDDDNNDELECGDFVQSVTYGLLEILQLKNINKFTHKSKLTDNLRCIAIPYKRETETIYYAEASFTMNTYFDLKELFRRKVCFVFYILYMKKYVVKIFSKSCCFIIIPLF